MKGILTDSIYINKKTSRFYILFNNTVYQFNGELINIEIEDIELLESNSFIKLTELNINSFYQYLRDIVDIYNILEINDFYKKGRLVKVTYNNSLYTGLIYDIKEKKINNKDVIIYSIDIFLETGEMLTITQDYIYTNIQPFASELDIKIDGIIEVLSYYNTENLNIDINKFK